MLLPATRVVANLVHRDGRITSLFEVKPDTLTTSITAQSANSQLHSTGLAGKLKLVFVEPENLSTTTSDKLKKIGIDLLGYR
jgi:hypothetical protein